MQFKKAQWFLFFLRVQHLRQSEVEKIGRVRELVSRLLVSFIILDKSKEKTWFIFESWYALI